MYEQDAPPTRRAFRLLVRVTTTLLYGALALSIVACVLATTVPTQVRCASSVMAWKLWLQDGCAYLEPDSVAHLGDLGFGGFGPLSPAQRAERRFFRVAPLWVPVGAFGLLLALVHILS